MKIRVLPFIITIGILGAGYLGIQRTNDSFNNSENSSEILQVEEKLSNMSVTNSVVSEEDEVQNQASAVSQSENQSQTEATIEGVPHIKQMPELARGCEVTSLAMLLQFAGVSVDKITLAKEIKTVPFRDQNGIRSNPNDGFVGDIYSFDNSGYGVYHGPIADLAETYLPGRIIDLTGEGIAAVYQQLNNGVPVWVVTNSRFALLPEDQFSIWDTSSGEVQITYREHSVLVVGYDENNVYINDPLADKAYTSVPKANFEAAWEQMGSQAVSYA
ncbi:C39 family peptidase [Bacillus sp. DNRA2]|uniref:C39 family peptidase n=1 Tax=Bacillus sp. DNRA2 TaxID=2723053 RepID=UPI002006DBE3|nr:C39 family peptidase [Bacillus sp. DNRA2]